MAQVDAKKYTYQEGSAEFSDWNKYFGKWSDNKEGYLLNLIILKNYTDLDIIYKPFVNEFNEKFSTNLVYKIFYTTGKTALSFLLPLTENSANFLLQKCLNNPLISFQEEITNYAEEEHDIDISIKEQYLQIVKRPDYLQYKKSIIKIWGKSCIITGIQNIPHLIEIAHIKPWSQSDNKERISEYNGIPLSSHLHVLFDVGLITIFKDGNIKYSDRLTPEILTQLGLLDIKIIQNKEKLTTQHKNFLEWHNQNIFKK